MGDNFGDELVTNLDLNREPFDGSAPPSPPAPSSPTLRSFLNELESSRSGIEDRIRVLEAVSARTRQPQRRRRIINNPALTFNFMPAIEPIVVVRNENQETNELNTGGDSTERVNDERLTNHTRDASHLAKALEMDLDAQKTDNDKAVDADDNNVNMFDCNICLGQARDPILTCCGHLFCWGCFYLVPYVDSISKECPVCKGEVTDSNITPIYGNGNGKNSQASELESRVRVPPRPQAHRVESVRQQIVNRGSVHIQMADVHIQMADAIRRIRIGLGMSAENHPPHSRNSLGSTSEISLTNSEAGRDDRLLPELNRSQRFGEGLESYVSNRIQPVYQVMDTSVADTTVHMQSEPQEYLAAAVLHLGTLATDGDFEIDMTVSPSRRTRGVSRTLSLEGETSLDARRRRLR